MPRRDEAIAERPPGRITAIQHNADGHDQIKSALLSFNRSQTNVWRIGVRYEDGTTATIQQTSSPNLRIGDRVRVTSSGIQLL